MGMEGLKWVQRALGGCGGPEMGIEGFGRHGGASDGREGVDMCLDQYDQYQALHIHVHLKLFTPISEYQALYTHLTHSTPTKRPS